MSKLAATTDASDIVSNVIVLGDHDPLPEDYVLVQPHIGIGMKVNAPVPIDRATAIEEIMRSYTDVHQHHVPYPAVVDEYYAVEKAAAQWKDSHFQGNPPAGIAASALANGRTPRAEVLAIEQRAAQLRTVLDNMRAARYTARKAIAEATDQAAVDAAVTTAIAALGKLIA